MKKTIVLKISCFTLFFVIFYSFGISQDLNKISLDGKWKFRKAGTTKWMEAQVPGEVHLDLLKNKVITDPFFRDNEQYQKWIGEIGWEYQKVFFIHDSLFVHRNIELVCKGLDTYANVFLNDSLIIVADNMFRTWYAPIKPILRTGLNTLRIQFPTVIGENKSRYDKLGYKLPGDEKVVCRKAAYQFGWESGPSFISSGIWQPIYIKYWDFVNVLGVQYIQNSLTDSMAAITAEFTMVSTLNDSALMKVSLNGNDIAKQWAILKKGVNVVSVKFDIRNPKRWWTNGLGTPYLYTCEHEVFFANKLCGKGFNRIGLKTLELLQKKDSLGDSFYFKLNGIPVFMKGAIYVPQDNFLTRVKDSNYREIIRNAAASNMNLLRVWGGGVYENDAFYDYCDENGILVWHDFMFANAMYPGVKEFVDNVQAEGIQQVVRLRNHPCIALWCGNSEIDESWRNSKWSGQYTFSTKDSSEIYLNYRMLFYEKLRNAVRKFDPKVPYIPSSPNTGWGNPFGIQAFPEMSSIRKFTTPADIMFDSPVIKSHQKSPDGDKLMDESLLQYYKKPINFDSYVYVSQLLQAEEIKNTIEGNRRAMPYSMGSLFWQLNDCWPGVTSSSTDYYGKKKALGYWIKDIYATTIVSPVIEDKKLRVYVVTDNLLSQKADLLIELVDFTGKSLMKKSVSLEIPANTSMIAFDTAVNAIIKNWKINEIVLLTTLKNGSRVISENNLYFDSPKNLNLQVPAIQKQITQIPEGYKVELSTDKLAKNIYLKMPFKGELPENYFDLIPGRPKTLIYITKTKFPDISNMVKITSLIDTY